MPIDCRLKTQGGRGNKGKFIERDPYGIVAAGRTQTVDQGSVKDCLQHYLLQEEADALISDAIIPAPEPRPLPPLRKPQPPDMRNAAPRTAVAELINPPMKTKFQTLVDDFKETSYKSYWKTPIGKGPDCVPLLPDGFDVEGTIFGKKAIYGERLYDIVMPKDPLPDKTPPSKQPGAQTDRNYCRPAFNPDLTYGHRTLVDERGTMMRCCLTNDKKRLGLADKTIINTIQANFLDAKQSRLGKGLAPNNNIREVPKGHSFGRLSRPDNIIECLSFCERNEGRDFFKECIQHLNTVKGVLAKRILPSFYRKFYLLLKYEDKEKTGWLPKDVVYRLCGNYFIRFNPALMEPLLKMWNAFDGSKINYKSFVHILNHKEASPETPKIEDFPPECLEYSTTYSDMVKPGKEPNNQFMAGEPSGRYFDRDYPVTPYGYCRAYRICFVQESDARSCINPSVLSQFLVNHRDLYEKQEPETVRQVFETIGEEFTDEKFNAVWAEAQKLHSQGWVCYETFRQALDKYSNDKK